MASAPYLRSGGARVYSQSGDIDQLLEDVWVPDDRGRLNERRSDASQRQPDQVVTEKERLLMAQLADAQRQLRELGRLRWDGDSGSGPQSPVRDGYGSDRPRQAWNSDRAAGGPERRHRGDYSNLHDSWDDSRDNSSGSRSLATNSDRESPEPLYVNTEIAAGAARAPPPPPRTHFPQQAASLLPAAAAASVPAARKGPTSEQNRSYHHQHCSEKESASKREESFEVKESVSVFQVFPPVGGTAGGLLPNQQPPPPPLPQAPSSPPGRRVHNFPTGDGGVSPSVFHFPNQARPVHSSSSSRGGQFTAASSSSAHQSSSSSRRAEQYHKHGQHPSAPVSQVQSPQRPGGGNPPVIGQEWGDSSVPHRTQHQRSQQQSYRAEVAHASCNSHSVTRQSTEATSSSQQQSQGESDVYSETTSLRPIGQGIQTLRSHTALHKLRQTESGFQIGTSRLRTLNLSTPHLDQPTPVASFRSDQQLAAPLQQGGVGPLRGGSSHVAAAGAPVQLLPMAFMVAMPTGAVSLQHLNMFSGISGLPTSNYPALTAAVQPHHHFESQHQRSASMRQQPQQQHHHQNQRSVHSSRSITRSQQIVSGGSSARGSSVGGGSFVGGGGGSAFRVSAAAPAASSLMPRVVVDTASSSGGSSTTIHAADFEADEKPYVELADLRPVRIGGASLSSSAAARRLQSSSGGARVELLRSAKTSSLRGGGSGARVSDSVSSSDHDDTVFNNATYDSATLQASAMEPRSSFMRASASSHHHHHQQQQQQHLQVSGFSETSRMQYRSSSSGGGGGGDGGGGSWMISPGSATPTRRLSGHSGGGSSTGGFDFDPPSPGGLLRFVTDTSQLWYLPNISREEAIGILRPLPPGRFVVRDSTSFPGAYGLAVKVAEVSPGAVAAASAAGDSTAADELVRHFLIEQTSKGVRIRGCANEPVFASLAALIYQHTVMPLALPCKLALPDAADATDATLDMASATGAVDPRVILEQGAACNVLYLGATDIESLTGAGGLARAVDALLRSRDRLRSCVSQLKVAKDGISLTDTARRQFFRKHYPTACVLYCAMDPGQRCFDSDDTKARGLSRSKIFGFVARKNPGSQENTAVVMCEIEEHQPAEAVVRFVCKYLIGGR